MSNDDIRSKVTLAPNNKKQVVNFRNLQQTYAAVSVDKHPEFTIGKWEQKKPPSGDDGLRDNPCWPSAIAADDPGFALLTYDAYYDTHDQPYDYQAAYVKGSNGS